MRGEQYYLVLIGKDETEYKVHTKPLTLKKIDEHTTKYENKRELIETILNNTKVIMNPKDIKDVVIYMKPNKNKEEYKKESGPIFKKDAMVLNENATAGKFELLAMNRIFALKFIRKYATISNFRSSIVEIEALINNNADYMKELEILAEKILSTYKGSRNAYLNMKFFDKEMKKTSKESLKDVIKNTTHITPPKANPKESIEYKKETPAEVKRDELEYLKEYERELLDIEDFNHYKSISPFDEHKKI